MTFYTAYTVSNDREQSGQPLVCSDLDTAPPTWLTAVPTAPVWCDERKLVEGGFQVSCIKNHHESIS